MLSQGKNRNDEQAEVRNCLRAFLVNILGLWLRRSIESAGLFITEITLTVVEEELRMEGRWVLRSRCCVFDTQRKIW